ncbi:MAG: hypothetical protein JXR52_07890 [Bacteroidales bacterium]|nr:hypothetical protein [Bacteroidales bacterium]
MKIYIILIGFLISFPQPGLFSQVILYEDFEDGIKPEGWTQEYVVGAVDWRYRNGGYNPSDPNLDNPITPNGEVDIARNPPAALEGNYNAFFFNQGDDNERTKLITPELDLMGATAVNLSFYLCQIPWTFEGSTGWDVLRVYYKVSETDPWVLLQEYLDPVYDWEKQILNLPNPSENYYVAFEGHTRWGFGTCVDSVLIEETGTQQLYVEEILSEQPHSLEVPSGSSNVPVIRTDLKVYGNSGTLSLNQITFTSLNSSDADLSSNGVRLYSTATQDFHTGNPLGNPTGFSGGKATFTALNHYLSPGHNYFWLAYDVAPGAIHKNRLDAMLRAGDVVTSGGAYPAADQSPPGERIIYHTCYSDDFEGTLNWALTGEFQLGTPAGLGGVPGNPDPAGAFSGLNALGTDLTGNGNYEPNLTSVTADMATSGNLNLLYYKDLNLFFTRYLNIEVWDNASIDISTDNGITWEPFWESNAYINDFQWNQEKIAIPSEFWRSDQLKVRFRLGPTNAFNNYSGWNIDDVYLTGEFIAKDVGVSEWISPQSGSGHTSSEPVTVRIRNYGGTAITETVPVAYSFNGGISWTIDQMDTDIPVDGSVEFTFPTRANLSEPGLRPAVIARTLLPGDQYAGNDRITTQVYVVPTYTPPHEEDFEENDGYWRSFGSGIWEYGTPAGTVINSAASGSHSWATGLSSDYGDMISEKNQVLFEDGFESDLGWSFTGEFERAMPDGIHLPWYPLYGYYCIGTDIQGLGDSLYKYENGITDATAYTATSPPLDVSDYSDLVLSYARWLMVRQNDTVRLEISSDNGANWHVLWQNNGAEIMDEWWVPVIMDIPDSYIFTDAMRFRFSLNYSSLSGEVAPGWNVDDILLTGNRISIEPAYLSSPAFDLTGIQCPVLTANLWIDTEAGTDGVNLQYSLDDGVNWTTISNPSGYDTYWNWYTGQPVTALEGPGWSGQSGGWISVKHLLPALLAGKSNVQFRFAFAADKIQNQYNGIAVDDVKVMEAPHDADLLAIVDPVSACELSFDQQFTLTIKNSGIAPIQAGEPVHIGYYIDHTGGVQTSEETYTLTQNLPVGNTLDITTGSEFDFSASGEYHVTVYVQNPEPHFYSPISADTVSSVILVEKPYVELGDIISTSRPDTIILKAFSGVGGQTYLWQDGSADSVFHVNTNGKYWVRVTNSLGCTASDIVRVVQLFPDVGVIAYLGPLSGCEVEPGLPPEVTIKNVGNDTLEIGSEIIIGGIINGAEPFYDTIILAQRFTPAEQFNHVYHGNFDFSVPNSYRMRLFTMMDTDENPANDTLYHNLEVYGYPDASLGDDITVDAMEYLLTPEPGHAEYLWQDGSTGETFTVDQPGTGIYHVTISNEYLCTSSDTIEVTLNVTDLELSQLLSPAGACEFSTAFNISAMVSNQGNQTVPAGQAITMGYRINQGTKITGQTILTNDLEPGGHFDFTFPENETFLPDQWYLFTVFVDFGTDVNRANDTITSLVHVFETSPIDLGEDRVETGLQYILDAGSGFVSYLWQDGSTGQTFTITSPGIGVYHVTVEDLNGCIASDTVRIMLSVPDIGVTEIVHPKTACHLGREEQVNVAVKNLGNWNLAPSAVVYVTYVINGEPEVTEPLELADSLKNGEVIHHTFSKIEDFGVPGTYNITAYTTYADDLFPGNDDASANIEHYGPVLEIRTDPASELDTDTLQIFGPVTLYVYQPYSSYSHLWQDGSTGMEYVIAEPSAGWYRVTAEGDYGCTGIDSLYVVYDRPDLEITGLASPVTSCAKDQISPVSLQIINNGFMDISTIEDLTATYSVNGASSVIEIFNLSASLGPGQTATITFTDGYDFSEPGIYNISTSLIYEKDLDYSNNTFSSEINIWENPEVEIGGGEDTIIASLPYTLDAGSGYASYLWQDNSTGSSNEVTNYGLYWVMVTNEHGCSARDSVYIDSEIGTDRTGLHNGTIRFYPNPADDFLYIDMEFDTEHAIIIEFYTILNKLVYRKDFSRTTEAETTIHVGDLPPGPYFLRIIADDILHSGLVIIE